MADDKVTAALEEIGYLHAVASALQADESAVAFDLGTIARRFDRTLTALEALAKPHQPGRHVVFGDVCQRHEYHPYFSITALEAADVKACPDCKATVYVSCAGCGPQVSLDACPVRQTITRELTGEETSGGER